MRPLKLLEGIISVFSDGDVIDPENGGVPIGGTTGQVLAKLSDDNNDVAWVTSGASSAMTVADTAPTLPHSKPLWFDSSELQLYVQYDDGTSVQWVSANSIIIGEGGGGVPAGGVEGDMLLKQSDTDGDATWVPLEDTAAEALGRISGGMHGVENRGASIISFVEGTRTFTITPASVSYVLYHYGTKITVSSPLSAVISDVSGGHYIVYNPNTGQLEDIGDIPSILYDLLIGYVYWNATAGVAIIVGDERHGVTRNLQWHRSTHLNIGAVWRSGAIYADEVLPNGYPAVYSEGSISVADEDLEHVISHAVEPISNPYYQQELEPFAKFPTLYMLGEEWYELPPSSDFVRRNISDEIMVNVYNWPTGWELGYEPVPEVDMEDVYYPYILVATNDFRRPLKWILPQESFFFKTQAEAVYIEPAGLPFAEFVPMYNCVVRVTEFGASIVSFIALKKMHTSTEGVAPSSHSALIDRAVEDAHPINAISGLSQMLPPEYGMHVLRAESVLNDDPLVHASGSGDDMPIAAETFAKRSLLKSYTWPGRSTVYQPNFFQHDIAMIRPMGNTTTVTLYGLTLTATGTATAAAVYTMSGDLQASRRIEYAVTTASTSAVAGFRVPSNLWNIGSEGLDISGFFSVFKFGRARGAAANATLRCFVGFSSLTSAPTDANPSTTIPSCIGVCCDAADTNYHLIVRAGSTATKIDTGIEKAAFDSEHMYELVIYSPVKSSSWEATVRFTRVTDGVSFEYTFEPATSQIPGPTVLMSPRGYYSVGGTSSVIGFALVGFYVEVLQ